MSPLVPTDPALLADRSSVGTPAVLTGYALLALFLLVRGVKHSWLDGGRTGESDRERSEP
ncbi:MAG: hypothetical protein ABEJ94_07180 [Halorientalis sp.]